MKQLLLIVVLLLSLLFSFSLSQDSHSIDASDDGTFEISSTESVYDEGEEASESEDSEETEVSAEEEASASADEDATVSEEDEEEASASADEEATVSDEDEEASVSEEDEEDEEVSESEDGEETEVSAEEEASASAEEEATVFEEDEEEATVSDEDEEASVSEEEATVSEEEDATVSEEEDATVSEEDEEEATVSDEDEEEATVSEEDEDETDESVEYENNEDFSEENDGEVDYNHDGSSEDDDGEVPFDVLPSNYIKIPYFKGKDIRYTLIGTLDDTSPDTTRLGSQYGAYYIPNGWSIATRNAEFEELFVDSNWKFGAECLVYADGTGVYTSGRTGNCGPGPIEVFEHQGRFALALPGSSKVSSRILITKDTSFKSPEAPCGICEVWGDPHVQPFDKSVPEYISAHEGSFVFYRSTTATPSFEIIYSQFEVGTATAISEIYIRYDTDILNFQTEDDDVVVYRGMKPVNFDADYRGQILVSNPQPGYYRVTLPNFVQLSINRFFFNDVPYLTSIIAAPNNLKGKTEGICGSCGESHSGDYEELYRRYKSGGSFKKRSLVDTADQETVNTQLKEKQSSVNVGLIAAAVAGGVFVVALVVFAVVMMTRGDGKTPYLPVHVYEN